jgi:GNAT superfamily N-acetyltransferase
MTSMTIRSLESQDHDEWYRLWRGYQQFYEVDLTAQTSAVTWQRLLDEHEPMHGALAIVAGKPLGLVHYIEHRSCWTVGNYVYLQDLFVDEAARGQGIGRALIEHVYAQAAKLGASRVHWLTHETNRHAMHLYDRIADRSGFVQYRKILSS